jgi:ATP-dependent exoDNAse (exonuclease V) beta subunit
MTGTLLAAGGEVKPLLLNFRSQPPLIHFFNYLFERLFQSNGEITPQERKELGYVDHEKSVAKRDPRDSGPLIELMVTTEASGEADDPKAEQTSRELDAEQLALRIVSLVGSAGILPAGEGLTSVSIEPENVVVNESRQDACAPECAPRYSDIALLFRAMTNIQIYESAFRRANIPYQTVLGRGFYEREEITDLIQLLRFLDNKTDELALAAVLRSPLGGISDNGLLALRCAPWLDELDTGDDLRHFTQIRPLYVALLRHSDIAFISGDEHQLLDRAAGMIKGLIARQHNYSLSQLLRFAVEQSDFETVIAATFDGAQRLANVQRLFTLAERFESSGAHLIRDFVRYVEEFEAIGSRESEGQIDEATNAVKLMTIHQAKGLEFPIVIIPDLQRSSKPPDDWFLLDRQRGLTLKVPDGRGKLVAGCTFTAFEQRHAWREQFESMRLLYVAATRAADRLILSGTTKDLDKLGIRTGTWLNWIWQSLELPAQTQSGIVELQGESGDVVQLQLTVNLAHEKSAETKEKGEDAYEKSTENAELMGDSISEAFPLLRPIEPQRDRAIHRFSVTQLINYQRCPRQYYFDRVLHAPAPDALAVWNDAEAPEPPANLTATIKGAVIHRFCETYSAKDDLEKLLRQSFDEVVRDRQAQLADRLVEINENEAITELFPLAQSYLQSAVFERVERARALSGTPALASGQEVTSRGPRNEMGLWSELSFRLRRPLGILTGAIDKLLITPNANGKGLDIEIIDFKTNRLRGSASTSSMGPRAPSPAGNASRQLGDQSNQLLQPGAQRGGRVSHPGGAAPPGTPGRPRSQSSRSQSSVGQIAFDFNSPAAAPLEATFAQDSLEDHIRMAASDYQLQMQAYALAVRELMPSFSTAGSSIRGTLHFLEPAMEFNIDSKLLSADACMHAIDDAMMSIVSSVMPREFPLRPANHCRMCNFLGICPAGREWVREVNK